MSSEWISRQPFWLALALLLAAANGLVAIDFNTTLAFHPFLLRLPGLLFFAAGMGITYWLGRKFFGAGAVMLALMIMASSPLLSNSFKWATGDAWIWFLLIATSLGMLGFLKQPRWYWRLLVWGSWTAALAIQPLEALAGVMAIAVIWRFRHPKGKNLDGLYLWFIGPAVTAAVWWWRGSGLTGMDFLWSWTSGHVPGGYGLQILGVFPWVGFLAAGAVDLVRNRSKGEELTVLLSGLAIGALLSNTLFLQWAFALLAAKQLQRFFEPGYPNGNIVKTLTVLQLVAWLLLGIGGLVYGYSQTGAQGFRAGMSLIMAFWIPGFFGVVGLFGKHHRLMTLGLAFGALLLTLAFWQNIHALLLVRNF